MTTPLRPDPHDRIYQQLRQTIPSGTERTPADATAVRRPTRQATWKEVGKQFMRGLGEAGVGTVEAAFNLLSGYSGAPVPAPVTEALQREHAQLREFYGTPKTEEATVANLVGNLVGGTALGAGIGRAAEVATAIKPKPYIEPLVGNDLIDIPTYQRAGGVPGEILDRPYLRSIQENQSFNQRFLDRLSNEQGSIPARKHASVSEETLNDLLDRAIFGKSSASLGPLTNPTREILPASDELPLKGNRLLVTDEMAARAQSPGQQRIMRDMTRAYNTRIRNSILANEDPLNILGSEYSIRPGSVIEKKSIFDFLKGLSQQ